MSFLFPRTIAIYRPVENLDVGMAPYGGVSRAKEDLVLDGIAASVQADSGSARPRAGDLPSSPPAPIQWSIYFRNTPATTADAIGDRDIVVDDLGRRFQISAAYNHSMGWSLMCIKLEAR